MNAPRVIVVGSFVQDLNFHCVEFPAPGETVMGKFATGPGGKGSNQAVASARAGARVAFIGAVGRDSFGSSARQFQQAEGIECLLVEKTDHPTGTAGILVDSHGQNEIIVSLNANNALSPADIDAHSGVFRQASVMVTQLEANLQAEGHAMQLARHAGATVILNPAPMRSDFDAALLRHVDILIPNETEFCALVDLLPPLRTAAGAGFNGARLQALQADGLHQLCRCAGVETIILTLGARGCFLSTPNKHALIPAIAGIKAVDTTGAGDAFVGAFATALAEFGLHEIDAAARFANAAAALSVTRFGAAPAMPLRAEIDALRSQHTQRVHS